MSELESFYAESHKNLGLATVNLDPELLKMIMVLASVWIRIGFKADPDPAFYFNADPDLVRL